MSDVNTSANASNEPPVNAAQVRLEERRIFAKLLHDNLAQEIMASAMLAEVLRRRLNTEESSLAGEATRLTEILTKAGGRLQEIIRTLDSSP